MRGAKTDMKAVILAGGLGERLRPFTQAIPKPLLPIGEQSLLELQISNLVDHGVDEVFVATNYKSNYIKNFIGDGSRLGVKIGYSEEVEPLGTCGPLSLLRDRLVEPFIMMNGDILTTLDFRKFQEFGLAQDSNFTVATKNIRTPFNFGSVESRGNQIVKVEEKPDFVMEIVAGIYFIKPDLLELVPDNQYFGIDGLISQMLADGMPITRYLMEEFWLDIGALDDYNDAEEAYREHFEARS
jgi:NDP-sugar pyrophosphorylase family protein